jgi:hypothetical protein
MVPSISMIVACLGAAMIGCSNRPSSAMAEARWPNEPPELNVVADWGFDQEPPTAGDVEISGSPGWNIVYGTPPDPFRGWVRRVRDDAAPMSPPFVYDFEYPKGMVEGVAPGTVYFPGPRHGITKYFPTPSTGFPGADRIYAGFWWKPSAPFDVGPNGNKLAFLFNGGGDRGGQQFLILGTDGCLHVLPEYPGDYKWRHPNVAQTVVKLGEWHRVEWYSQLSTGTMKWWLDGILQGSYEDVKNPYSFDMFQFSPTWGGNTGAKKRETDHFWFDHLRLSVGK